MHPEVDHAMRELEAAKARVERDAKAVADDMRRRLVTELLPVLDNLDRTVAAARDAGDAPAVVEGVQLVRVQLESVLRGYGVERIDAIAKPFDPALHDAVGMLDVHDRGYHDIVIDQLQPCYLYGATLLRPAKVVVGRCTTPR
ncbi:MAG TPA: nucleotide exchange factor GrpE [Kofleriaceae bacterium]|nr:nucleotide exchange factor GrpE [Kofleriaceae bacterium]